MEGNISKRGCIALQSIVQSTICEKTLKYHNFPIDEAFQMSDEEDIERNYLREEQKN